MLFGWQPYNDGTLQLSADTWEAFNNPAQWNYTDNPMIGQGGSSASMGGFFGGIGRGTVPGGAGGANSGQGGMGAGSLYGGPWLAGGGTGASGILAALAGHNFSKRNTLRDVKAT